MPTHREDCFAAELSDRIVPAAILQHQNPPLNRNVRFCEPPCAPATINCYGYVGGEVGLKTRTATELPIVASRKTQYIIGGNAMIRKLVIAALACAAMSVTTTAFAQGTAPEAKAMLEKAVAAVKADKAKAIKSFLEGTDGFKDRDLYPFCFNTSDGITQAAPASVLGKDVRTLVLLCHERRCGF